MREAGRGITWRSVSLGFLLAAGLCIITPYNDYVVGNTYIAGNHFPLGGVAVLLLLSLFNFILFHFRGRPFLTTRETAVVYIIIMVTSGLPSSGLLRYMIPCGTVPYYFANAGNRWEQLFWSRIPDWMAVSDPEAATWFWEGLPEGQAMPWRPWIKMMSHWSILFGGFWAVMISLSSLVRRQWADRERLAFPLVQFPAEVLRQDESGPSAPFFKNKLVWIGAGLVFLIHLLTGLHRYFPAVPGITTFYNLDPSIPDRPWSAAAPLYMAFFFGAIGFGYLLSLEVSAGFWASVLYLKAQAILLAVFGFEGDSAWSGDLSKVSNGQQLGGLLVLAFVFIWLLRGTFIDAFRKAFSRAPEIDDSTEPLSYRAAVFTFIIGLLLSLGWLVAGGMNPLAACGFMFFFLAICLVLTRIVAEAGMLMVHLSFAPTDYLKLFGGTRALGPANLTVLTFVDCALTFDLREFLMPSVLNAFRLADAEGISTRKLIAPLVTGLVMCVIISIPAFLLTFYLPGAAQVGNIVELRMHPTRYFTLLGNRLEANEQYVALDYISMLSGGAIVGLLSWLRLNYVWWPIHPLGFVMGTSWASLNLWYSLLIGWFLKLLTIRYTGLAGYVRYRPLFLGVILGDVLGAVLWDIVGWFMGSGFMVTVN